MVRRRGLTFVEVLVTVAVIAVLGVLVVLVMPSFHHEGRHAPTMKDKTQLRQIHTTMLVFAKENKGRMPRPGLIDRLRDPYIGDDLPGLGPEDVSLNHTANLYSAMIAMEYFNPDILIGPTEVNDQVQEDLDYDYDQYDPATDRYWDPAFLAELEDESRECNTSYTHMALCGHRVSKKWTANAYFAVPMLGSRGTRGGVDQGPEYDRSPTLLLHGSKRTWVGNVVFGDNHAENLENFFPPLTVYAPAGEGTEMRDNIYAAEFDGGQAAADAFLVICNESDRNSIGRPLHDLLP